MKKVLICGVAALVVLLAGGTALTKETARKQAKNSAESSKPAADLKQAKEQLKEMTPEQRRSVLAKKALEEELAPWQAVRKIAVEENATKTVAAIDKIMTAKQEQFKKKFEATKTEKGAATEKASPESKRREPQRAERKKNAPAQP